MVLKRRKILPEMISQTKPTPTEIFLSNLTNMAIAWIAPNKKNVQAEILTSLELIFKNPYFFSVILNGCITYLPHRQAGDPPQAKSKL